MNVFVHSSCHEGLAVVQRVRIVSYVDRWRLFPLEPELAVYSPPIVVRNSK